MESDLPVSAIFKLLLYDSCNPKNCLLLPFCWLNKINLMTVVKQYCEFNIHTYLHPFFCFLTTNNSLPCLYSNILRTNGKRSFAHPLTSTMSSCPASQMILKSAVYDHCRLVLSPVPLHVLQLIGLPVLGDGTLPSTHRPQLTVNSSINIKWGCNSMSFTSSRPNKCL